MCIRDRVVEEMKTLSTPVEGKQDIAHIAAISGNDPEVGEIIADAMDKVGKDGVITVEESKGTATVSYTHLDVYKRQFQFR